VARHRRTSREPWVRWLQVGAVAAGMAAAISSGQAIASATPSEEANPGADADSSPATDRPDGMPGGQPAA
jgi:hypothetical protein